MPNQRLQQRLEQLQKQPPVSHRRPWFRRPWGRLALFFGVVLMAGLAYYLYLTVRYVTQIKELNLGQSLEQLKNDEVFNKLVTSDDPIIGPPQPQVIIVAFEDFQCPFCLKAQPILKQMLAKYQDKVAFIYRDFPLRDIHDQAQGSAEAANCALDQGKFWEYHDQLFAQQDQLSEVTYRKIAESLGLDLSAFNTCLNNHKYATEIQADLQTGLDLGVIGTPTFFINGQIFPGVLPMEVWDKVLGILTS